MRIIAGEYRGRVLKSPSDLKTRPTSDRLRETLFNILNPQISDDTNFLDLCAGTGAIGIEAISRGANLAVFVDISKKCCALIEQNLDILNIPEEKTEVYCNSAEKFLINPTKSFDIVYFDPPYQNDYAKVLQQLGAKDSKILNIDGIVIAEHSAKQLMPDLIGELRRWRLLKQGDSCLSFYERN
ncbi:MAG: 16S rRNA (guanine(966)-N(2))-methyltransferase RsmD [Pyrinomonadaceae bacterium]|jgi:16S rRNA (guanine(966)-N(2))-methyltransferase RsmD|nr:16S rRNA (guanine(966)-N(2))-methyltransferase RsmD [Pyrinomonadaceae bacterium]